MTDFIHHFFKTETIVIFNADAQMALTVSEASSPMFIMILIQESNVGANRISCKDIWDD